VSVARLLFVALCWQDAPPAPAPAPAPKAAVDPAHVARLAAQRERLQAQLAAQEKYADEEKRFIEALRAVIEVHPPGSVEGVGSFWEVKRGKAPAGAFTSFQIWHTMRTDRPRPVSVDYSLPLHPYSVIVDFSKQIRARGAELLLVTLPTKLEVHPDLVLDVPAIEGFAGMGSGTSRFLLALNEAGVETLDLSVPFVAARQPPDADAGELYLHADAHWAPRGAETAAKAVADAVAEYPWFKSGPLIVGRDLHLEKREIDYNPGQELMRVGAEMQRVKANVVLLGVTMLDAVSATSPFILLGDSHVRLYRATGCDFCAHFCRYTGWKLDVIQSFGGAADQVRRKLAHRTPSEWEGKKLVIWIVPETLLVPAPWWKPVKFDGK
jgi:hypothetical protein